jgi:hypothetical protein
LGPSIGRPDRWFKVFDTRPQRVNRTTLMAIGCVFLIFISPYGLFLNTLENELQGFRVNICCTAISGHYRCKLFE